MFELLLRKFARILNDNISTCLQCELCYFDENNLGSRKKNVLDKFVPSL